MSEALPIILRDLPLIAEIERLIVSGQSWAKNFETRTDEVSTALFGVTKADTVAATEAVAPSSRGWDMAATRKDAEARGDLERLMTAPAEREVSVDEYYFWWEERGFDIEGEPGSWIPLRCLYLFERQMLAAAGELMPGAKLTPDGSGNRAAQTAEAWGGSLAADAAKFIARKR